MGLDIYFEKQPVEASTDDKSTRTEVAYFRKFNALVRWIDANVEEVENCKFVRLERVHLEKLRDTLELLNKENSESLFATAEGFFFGSQEYDEGYWSDVRKLRELVDEWLNGHDFNKDKLLFLAWW